MNNKLTWMLFLILSSVMVTSNPVRGNSGNGEIDVNSSRSRLPAGKNKIKDEVISVSITSSVAIGRGKKRVLNSKTSDDLDAHESASAPPAVAELEPPAADDEATHTDTSLDLAGANIEFIKQLHSKKEARGTHHLEQVHPFQLQIKNHTTEFAEDTKQSLDASEKIDELPEHLENIPVGRSIALSPSSQNYIQGLPLPSERGQGQRLTTVSFNIVHDTPKTITNYNERNEPAGRAFPDLQQIYSEPAKIYSEPAKIYNEPAKIYNEPAKIYSEPAKIYSEPAKVYSEPAKVYSEPAKVYSEPAKVYSEPAKVYSEPAKVYTEPAKFYSPAASLNLPPPVAQSPTQWQQMSTEMKADTTIETTSLSTTLLPVSPALHEVLGRPEKNYEVDEKDSVLTNGRQYEVQEQSPENCQDDNCKVGYVVEGRQYRKYRVEERTSDGYIVGEYGVVRNEDGALRGVRYTADSDASPSLIYDALMKFLQLK